MPSSRLSLPRLLERLGRPMTAQELEEALFSSKAEVSAADGEELEVSVTPDRLDLLSEGGLALYLEGALGTVEGAVRYRKARPTATPLRAVVDASVVPLRPFLSAVVVRPPTGRRLDVGLLAEAVRFQEMLHASVGRDRRAMSLGIYPARRLRPPLRYAMEPIADVAFRPLGSDVSVSGPSFFAEHPYAARYGGLGRDGERCLTLRDAQGLVLSLPPILNSRDAGEAAPGDRALLLESTGTRARSVHDGLGLLQVVFASRGWSVAPVAIEGPGEATTDGSSAVAGPPVVMPTELARSVSGLQLPGPEIGAALRRARLGARRVRGGWRVSVPAWRPDLLTPIDLVEEVVLARGLRAEDGVLPPSELRGRRRVESRFREEVADLLLGLGLAAPNTTVLISEEAARRLPGTAPVGLANPVSLEYAAVRDSLLASHLEVLARNARHGYPQRFGEVAPVIVPDAKSESGASTRYRAGIVVAGESAGFAEVAAIVDYLLRVYDVGSVREPAALPGTIPGRGARVRVAGEPVAELGEVDPAILSAVGVPVPAAWAEVDLTALGPLIVRRDSTK